MAAQQRTFRAFNGLRFFAALAVVCYHYGPLTAGFAGAPEVVQNLVWAGPIALSFFFVLSGFVLAYAYAARLPVTARARKSFWFARFARLYPVYLLAFVLFIPSAAVKYFWHPPAGLHGSTFFVGMAVTLPALQAWTPYALSWNGPGWSLSVEAFFYFIFPWVVGPILRMRPELLTAGLSGAWVGMVTLAYLVDAGPISRSLWHHWIEFNPLFWTPVFLTGIATYRAYAAGWRVPAGWVAGVWVALLALCAGLSLHPRQIFLYGGGMPLLALLILALAGEGKWAERVLGARGLYLAGAASYSAYILQAPLWHGYVLLTSTWTHHLGERGSASWILFSFLFVLVGCSLVVHVWLEEPAKRWLLGRRAGRLRDAGIEAV